MIKIEGEYHVDMLSLTKEEEKLIVDGFNALVKEPKDLVLTVNGIKLYYSAILFYVAREVKKQKK